MTVGKGARRSGKLVHWPFVILAGHPGIALLENRPRDGFLDRSGTSLMDGRIAQVVEQLTLNQRVVGSSPTAPTKEIKGLRAKSSHFASSATA